MRINWNEPRFGDEEIEEVKKVIKDNYVNEGPKTKEFEEEIKKYLGVKHVILTANATAALFLAVKADSIIKGKEDFEVIVPDLTMIATATAVGWAGGKPVLADVEKNRLTIDCNKIEEKITEKTIAIMPVHILGRAADLEKLTEIANKHRLSIIEDAAGALGSKYKGRYLGTFGKVGIFSLQSNKIITSGQGGIIVTDDDKYYEIIRRLRDFGRFSNKEFLHEIEGYNLKFSDLSAALAYAQLKKISERKELLIKQRKRYEKNLNIPEITFFRLNEEEIPLWVDVICEDRQGLVEYLKSNEIYTRECWPAIHQNPPYKEQGVFPVSEKMSGTVLWLPNGPAITGEQIDLISLKIKEFYKRLKLEKLHEDKRGQIHLVKNLLENNKEFTFLEIKNGFARGGCLHSRDENFVVISGRVKVISGSREWEAKAGESGTFKAFEPHAFVALEDSIVSEWGITTQEKEMDVKNPALRDIISEINKKAETI